MSNPAVAFSDTDKERIRYHMNYPNIEIGAQLLGGTAFSTEVSFILEYNMNNMRPEGYNRVMSMLNILDQIELQMVDALTRLKAAKADVVTLNANEHLSLQEQYVYWQDRMAKQLSVPVNPLPPPRTGMNGINARVGA